MSVLYGKSLSPYCSSVASRISSRLPKRNALTKQELFQPRFADSQTATGPPASQTNSAQSSGSAGAAAATGAAVHVIGPGVAFAGVAVAALALL